jgi:hypothetical protein
MQVSGVSNVEDTDVRSFARDAPNMAPSSVVLELSNHLSLLGAQLFHLGLIRIVGDADGHGDLEQHECSPFGPGDKCRSGCLMRHRMAAGP